jgi:predicted transcriptional regulator
MDQPVKKRPKSFNDLSNAIAWTQVAGLIANGATISEIATNLGCTVQTARRLIDTPECRRRIEEIAGRVKAVHLNRAMLSMASRLDDAFEALDSALKSASEETRLKAAIVVFKAVGVTEQKDSGEKQDTTIVVNLPGQQAPKDITPEYTEISDEKA